MVGFLWVSLFFIFDANSVAVSNNNPKLSPNIVSSSEILEGIYSFRICYEYDRHYFPTHFYKNPFNATVEEINIEDLNFVMPLIEQELRHYGKVIYDKIDAIFMAESINIYGQDLGVFSLGRILYIPVLSDNRKLSAAEITEGIHKEIHSILYDYYPSIIAQTEWKTAEDFNARFTTDSIENLNIQSLYSLGFVSDESFQNTKNDFINIGYWYHSKRNDLRLLESKYQLIKEKVDKYRLFIELLGPNINCGNFSVDQEVQEFYGEYGVFINYCYTINNFPRLWTNFGRVSAEQISDKDKDLIINVLRKVFVSFDSFSISSVLKNIYLVQNLMWDNSLVNSLHYSNRLYISINEDTIESQNIENSVADAVAYQLAWIFRINFNFLFPVDQWSDIHQDELNAGVDFTEENNEEVINYIKLMILINSSYSDLVPYEIIDSKKSSIILEFFNSIKYWLASNDQEENELILASEKLMKKYDVAIWWDVKQPNGYFRFPALLRIEEKIYLQQIARTIDIIESFLSKYPAYFIQNELKNIVLSHSVYNVNSTRNIAGNYEETSKTLFLSNTGDDDVFLEGVLHHEMGHLLLDSYESIFNTEKWMSYNLPEYDYVRGGFGSINSLFEINSYYLEKGFLNKYSTRSLDEDFAEFFKMHFNNNEMLVQIAKNYPRIQSKYDVMLDFIDKLLLNN